MHYDTCVRKVALGRGREKRG